MLCTLKETLPIELFPYIFIADLILLPNFIMIEISIHQGKKDAISICHRTKQILNKFFSFIYFTYHLRIYIEKGRCERR